MADNNKKSNFSSLSQGEQTESYSYQYEQEVTFFPLFGRGLVERLLFIY